MPYVRRSSSVSRRPGVAPRRGMGDDGAFDVSGIVAAPAVPASNPPVLNPFGDIATTAIVLYGGAALAGILMLSLLLGGRR